MTSHRLFKWLFIVLGLSLGSSNAYSQTLFTEDFNSGTLGSFVINTAGAAVSPIDACDVEAIRDNMWSFADTFDIQAPLGTTAMSTLSIAFEYKLLDYVFSGGGAPTTGNFGSYEFQLSSSASGPWTTFYTMDQSNHVASSSCALVAVPNVSVTPGTVFLRIAGSWTSGDYYLHLDNFNVYEGGFPCLEPSSLNTTNITSTSAEGTWVSNGPGNEFTLEIGAPGFTPGTGTGVVVNGITSTSQMASGLSPNTTYDWYVREVCGVADTSNYAGPATFTTNCTPLSIPSTENFDMGSWMSGTGFGNTGDAIDNCWSRNPGNSSSFFWGTRTGTTGSGSTGPDNDFSGTGNYLFTEASNGGTGDSAFIASPLLDVSTVSNVEVGFYYLMYGGSTGQLILQVNDGGSWTSLWDLSGEQHTSGAGSNWTQAVTYYNPINNNIQFRFVGIRGTSFDGDMAIDEFSATVAPNCIPPVSVTVDSAGPTFADISWGQLGSAGSWEVEYGPTGFAQGSGTIVTSSMMNTQLTALQGNRTYDVYVRSFCGATDTSAWSGPVTFTTACNGPIAAGVYTLDANSAPSATNYASFNVLASDLSACGISGPITVNVVANSGPYNGRLVLGQIAGASATNNVVINGNGNVLVDTATVSADRATVLLDGTDHLTISNLTIEALGTVGFGIQLTNNADSNTIDNCVININQGSTSSSLAGIVMSNSNTSATSTGDLSSGNTISNNTVNGGYYSVTVIGDGTTSFGQSNKVMNNTLNDFYFYGVYARYQEDLEVVGNDISRLNRTSTSSFYGLYIYDEQYGAFIANNKIHDAATSDPSSTSLAYCMYFNSTDGSAAKPVRVQNNTVYNINNNGTTYGAYFTSSGSEIQFYHNTIVLDHLGHTGSSSIRGLYHTGSAVNFDHKNNIIQVNNGSSGTHHGIYFSNSSAGVTSDNNVVNVISPNSSNNYFGRLGTSDYTDLSAWQVGTTQDANSSEGDPIFTAPSSGDLTPLNLVVDNIGTPLGVVTDITGASRSLTTPDAGAYEFTGISSELALVGGSLERGTCYSSNDTVVLYVQNLLGSSVDFSVDPLTANWSVSGPNNSSGNTTVNSGTLAVSDSLTIVLTGVDMSSPGLYTLDANISPNAVNTISANDTLMGVTLMVNKLVAANPSYTLITNDTDSVELRAASGFFPSAGFTITEICQFQTTTGQPVGGWPSYFAGDDYLEITGAPGSDLGGYTMEQWSTTSQTGSYSFPTGTVLNSSGTAIIILGATGTDDPANALYFADGMGTSGSSTQEGRILRDPQGNIEDAVGYSGSGTSYSFPAGANVPLSEWDDTPALPSSNSTSGIRLEGADMNSGMNWVASATSPQDPNTVNTGVTVPATPPVPGFEWTLGGTQLTTNTAYWAGPFATNGVREYVAEYNDMSASNCGLIYDTAIVEVQLPFNDSCALAFEITSNGIYSCNPVNSGGTANHANATHANWFYFDAPSDGEILVSSCGTLVDTRLWIMTGTCGATTDVAADDDGCGPNFESIIQNFPVTSGTRYYIQWDDRWSGSGFNFLFEFNSCLSPSGLSTSNVTPTSVDINFTASDTAQIEWGPFGFAQGSGTLINNASSPQAITGLTPVTLYEYYIRNLCASGDTSAWIGPIGFSSGITPCSIANAPSVADESACIGSSAVLTATLGDPNNSVAWYDAVGGPQIGNGTPFTTPVVTGNTDYYAAEIKGTGGDQVHVGPAAPTGTLSFPGGNFSNGIWFTVLEPLVLDSMTLVVNDALDGSINISTDEPGAGGTLLQSFNYSLPAAGTFQIPAGVILDAGNYYMNLGGSVGPGVLFRSTSGANYPSYVYDGVVSIDSTNFGGGSAGTRFYYFWDWVVNSGCASPLDTAQVTALPQPPADFTFSVNNLTVDFTSITSNPDSTIWDFGDGNSSNQLNPQNVYAAPGTYNVSLTVYTGGCDSTVSDSVSVVTGLSNRFNNDVNIYPNPTSGTVVLESKNVTFKEVHVLDMLGNLVFDENIVFETQATINLAHLPSGSYYIKLISEEGIAVKRIVLSK